MIDLLSFGSRGCSVLQKFNFDDPVIGDLKYLRYRQVSAFGSWRENRSRRVLHSEGTRKDRFFASYRSDLLRVRPDCRVFTSGPRSGLGACRVGRCCGSGKFSSANDISATPAMLGILKLQFSNVKGALQASEEQKQRRFLPPIEHSVFAISDRFFIFVVPEVQDRVCRVAESGDPAFHPSSIVEKIYRQRLHHGQVGVWKFTELGNLADQGSALPQRISRQ
jgi:hypothetical protein